MPPVSFARRALSLATFRETRGRLRTRGAWALVAGIASAYAFLSMLIGQMLTFESLQGSSFVAIYWQGNGTHPWDFPALLVQQPWGVLALPFFPTVAMVLVALGVGVGGTVGALLLVPILRRARGTDRRAGAAGAAAGVGPAITGLATLGACCCTGCASAAAISVVAATSGASLNQLLLNDWYIGVFQLAVVYVSLMAQERTLRRSLEFCPVPRRLDRRFAVGGLLRMGLLIAGITWSLAMLIEWATVSPLTAPAAAWYHWIFEHQLLALTAIAAGLFPREFATAVRRFGSAWTGRGARLALLVAALSWGVWVPAYLVVYGLGGFLNELFGFWGLSAAWGSIPPDAPLGAPLYFHWAFQHLLLAAFALGLAVFPRATVTPLLWSVEASESTPVLTGSASPPADPTPRGLNLPTGMATAADGTGGVAQDNSSAVG